MIILGTRVKIADEGKGSVTDLELIDGHAYAEVTLDNGKVIRSSGPEMEIVFR